MNCMDLNLNCLVKKERYTVSICIQFVRNTKRWKSEDADKHRRRRQGKNIKIWHYCFFQFTRMFQIDASPKFGKKVKVKEWEETREEQKRRILEGVGSGCLGLVGLPF